MSFRGFTLVELVVAIAIWAVVSVASLRLLSRHNEFHRRHLARVEVQRSLRLVKSVLSPTLRQLDASDAQGGDLVTAGAESITYRALRNTSFLCREPDRLAGTITINPTRWVGSEALAPAEQRFRALVLDSTATERWLPLELTPVAGPDCEPGKPGLTYVVAPADSAMILSAGVPVEGYVVERIASYADAKGDIWLGLQQQDKASGQWPATQPFAGPLAAPGIRFSYFDSLGRVTSHTAEVALIEVTVWARSPAPLGLNRAGEKQFLVDSATFAVALRNNGRP